jgi:hypothetical protein
VIRIPLNICILLVGIYGPIAAAGTVQTFDFEGFADSTTLNSQYTGLLFSNTRVLTAGLSLNDIEFPPHSGTNVAADSGGPVSVVFSSPILSFSGFFTYSVGLTITAFDSSNQIVATTDSAFAANFVSSGNPPNELLQVSFAGGISEVSILGNPAGGSFVVDDMTVTSPGSTVPEPSSGLMVLSAIASSGILARVLRVTPKR